MEKKKKIIKCVAFFCVLVLIAGAFTVVLIPKNNSSEAGIFYRDEKATGILLEPENTIDVVVLGDSESFTAISPLQLWMEQGISAYVCGQSGQRVVEAYHWLEEIFKRQSPEVVILETNMLYRYEGTVTEMDFSLLEKVERYIPLFKYHDRWKNVKRTDLVFDYTWDNLDMLRGYEIMDTAIPYEEGVYMDANVSLEELTEREAAADAVNPMIQEKTASAEEVPDIVKHYLKKIQELCQQNDAKILLLSVPSPKNWNYIKHSGVSAYAAEQELEFLDLNLCQEELNLDWNMDTPDSGDHVNVLGAEKVGTYIGQYLKENYNLNDYREDPAYQTWNEDAEEYKKMVEESRQLILQ